MIKLRGKKQDGEWVYGGYYGDETRAWIVTVTPTNFGRSIIKHEVDPKTVGRFIGRYDEAGQEIYEGDLIGFCDATSTESGYYECNCVGEVVFSPDTVSFEVTNRLSAESYEVFDECAVIDNIHDNPDLLKS